MWVKITEMKIACIDQRVKGMAFMCSCSLCLQTSEPWVYTPSCSIFLPATFSHQSFSITCSLGEDWEEAQSKGLKEEGTMALFLQRNMLLAEEKNTSFTPICLCCLKSYSF